jgi:hypothetical protein
MHPVLSAHYHWRYLHLVAHVPRYSLEMVHFGQMQSVPSFEVIWTVLNLWYSAPGWDDVICCISLEI